MKNKFLKIGMLVAAVALASFESKAQVLYGNARQVVNSNGNPTPTNVVAFPFFPNQIGSTVSITNLVPIVLPYGYNQVAIQVTGTGTNSAATSNVVWTVYKSVTGGSPTNAVGGNLLLDVVGYITNACGTTTVATYGVDGKAASTLQSSDIGIGGLPYLYLGNIQVLTVSGYTNYTAWVNIK